jgi:hypothetical protein
MVWNLAVAFLPLGTIQTKEKLPCYSTIRLEHSMLRYGLKALIIDHTSSVAPRNPNPNIFDGTWTTQGNLRDPTDA